MNLHSVKNFLNSELMPQIIGVILGGIGGLVLGGVITDQADKEIIIEENTDGNNTELSE